MEKIGTFLGVIAIGLVVIFVLAFPVQWLWNHCLVPAGLNSMTEYAISVRKPTK